MLRETITNVRIDLTEGRPWIAKVEVVLPSLQVPVQPLNQVRDRLEALPIGFVNLIWPTFDTLIWPTPWTTIFMT